MYENVGNVYNPIQGQWLFKMNELLVEPPKLPEEPPKLPEEDYVIVDPIPKQQTWSDFFFRRDSYVTKKPKSPKPPIIELPAPVMTEPSLTEAKVPQHVMPPAVIKAVESVAGPAPVVVQNPIGNILNNLGELCTKIFTDQIDIPSVQKDLLQLLGKLKEYQYQVNPNDSIPKFWDVIIKHPSDDLCRAISCVFPAGSYEQGRIVVTSTSGEFLKFMFTAKNDKKQGILWAKKYCLINGIKYCPKPNKSITCIRFSKGDGFYFSKLGMNFSVKAVVSDNNIGHFIFIKNNKYFDHGELFCHFSKLGDKKIIHVVLKDLIPRIETYFTRTQFAPNHTYEYKAISTIQEERMKGLDKLRLVFQNATYS